MSEAVSVTEELPDYWESTTKVLKETSKRVFGVSCGQRKEGKET